MPPNTNWSGQAKKPEVQLNSKGAAWKNLMNECLLNSEIFPKKDVTYMQHLDPNVLMDARHEMVKSHPNFYKTFPTPKEQIQIEAIKLIKEENHKRLLKQKEEKLIKTEIEKLQQSIENYRLASKKTTEFLEKSKVKSSITIPKFSKRYIKMWRRFESYEGACEIDTWYSESVNMTMQTKINELGVPFEVKVHLKRKVKNEENLGCCLAPVSCTRKGSIIDVDDDTCNRLNYEDQCVESGKNEIMQRFLNSSQFGLNSTENFTTKNEELVCVEKSATNNGERENNKRLDEKSPETSNRSNIELAWKEWRNFTLLSKQRKQEKKLYQDKIESFLAKLQKRSIENSKSLLTTNSKTKITKEEKLKQSKQNKNYFKCRNDCKKEKMHKIEEDLRQSEKDIRDRLVAIEKLQPKTREKIRVLKTLSNISDVDKPKVFPNPAFLRRMVRRQDERRMRWSELQERKMKMQEEEKEIQKQKKKEMEALEVEEKRKKRHKLKEKRRQELEKKEEEKRNKEKLRNQIKLAGNHYRKYLLYRFGFRPWKELVELRDVQYQQALEFDDRRSLKEAFSKWKKFFEERTRQNNFRVDIVYQNILKRKYFRIWGEKRWRRIEQYQAAVDWNDLRITDRMFKRWMAFVQEEHLEYLDKKEIAESRYRRNLQKKYLKMWRKYPEVKRLEIVKENRKRVWRQKVQEILPDYRPLEVLGNL